MKVSSKQAVALIKVALLVGVMTIAVRVGMHIVPTYHSEQAKAQTGIPNPHIDYIYLNGSPASMVTITPGASVTIEVQATNVGTVAGYGGWIIISFPEFDSYGDADFVDLGNLWTSSGDNDVMYIENRPGGDPFWYNCGSGYSAPPQKLRVVGRAPSDWEPGESVGLEIKVTPPTSDTYWVYVRAVAADASGEYYYDPTSGASTDQQCRYVYSRAINPYTAHLPAVLKDYSPPEPTRGVWMQSRGCRDEATCDERLDCLQAAGVTRLYYCVYTGVAYYDSQLLPHRSFDSLAYLVPAARAQGMEVYAAMDSGYMGWREHPEWNARLNHPGVTSDWLDFAHPEARTFLADVAEEIVTNYDVAGITLDYTRWRREWYRQADLSADDISLTVRGVYERVKAARPDVLLAATPDGDHEYSSYWLGQRWHDWLDGGYIDYVVPMAYHEDNWLRDRLDEWRDTGHFPRRIVPLLATAWYEWNPGHDQEEPKTAEEVLHQIHICYDAGSAGRVTLFDDRLICENQDLVEALGAGGW